MSSSAGGSPREPTLSQTVCAACRQRKTRCDRKRPECTYCLKSGLECRYIMSQQTPGLRAGYVAQLDKRLARLEEDFHEFKMNASPQAEVPASLRPSPTILLEPLPTVSYLQTTKTSTTTSSLGLDGVTLSGYCSIWFEHYHSWFPILHQPTVLNACQDYADHPTSPLSLVLKSIVIVVAPTQPLSPSTTDLQRREELLALGNEIMLASMHQFCLQSLQALLILSIQELGAGRFFEFYNLIALSKRISTLLGLRDLVAYHCMNYGVSSVMPPRMLFVPTTAVEREEKIRAFWATEALDSSSTLGAAWHDSISPPVPSASVPCGEELWQFPESIMAVYYFGNSDTPSSFSLYVRLATDELWHVHRFLQRSYDQTSSADQGLREPECDNIYQRLMTWHSDFNHVLSVNTPPYTDLFSTYNNTTQHPNSTLIHCNIYSAVICLYQRRCLQDSPTTQSCWEVAADRCLAACEQLVIMIRGCEDTMLEKTTPFIIPCIFVVGRFLIIYRKALNDTVSEKVYLLIYALTVIGKRWSLARQLQKVLEAAVAECNNAFAHVNPLPKEFYDLQYQSVDIYEALRQRAPECSGYM